VFYQMVMLPWVTPNPQTTSIYAFFVAFSIFIVGEHRLQIWYTDWL